MALRLEPDADAAIASVLGVVRMDPVATVRTLDEIAQFVASGDATLAAQLIHAAGVRNTPGENGSGRGME